MKKKLKDGRSSSPTKIYFFMDIKFSAKKYDAFFYFNFLFIES